MEALSSTSSSTSPSNSSSTSSSASVSASSTYQLHHHLRYKAQSSSSQSHFPCIMPFVRVNTVFFDFRNTFFPSQLETHRWLRSLEIADGDVMIVNFNTYSKELVVKFSTEEKYLKFLAKGKGYYTIMRDGESYDIPYRQALRQIDIRHPLSISKKKCSS